MKPETGGLIIFLAIYWAAVSAFVLVPTKRVLTKTAERLCHCIAPLTIIVCVIYVVYVVHPSRP